MRLSDKAAYDYFDMSAGEMVLLTTNLPDAEVAQLFNTSVQAGIGKPYKMTLWLVDSNNATVTRIIGAEGPATKRKALLPIVGSNTADVPSTSFF